MSGRRGFLGFVGGAFVAGGVKVAQAAKPTLLLPPGFAQAVALPPIAPRLSPLVQMGRIMDGLPIDMFDDWLSVGLRLVEACKPGGSIHRVALEDEGRDLAEEVRQARAEHVQWMAGRGLGRYAGEP